MSSHSYMTWFAVGTGLVSLLPPSNRQQLSAEAPPNFDAGNNTPELTPSVTGPAAGESVDHGQGGVPTPFR